MNAPLTPPTPPTPSRLAGVDELHENIPRILHQVWVGEVPAWVGRLWKMWDDMLEPHGWTIHRWTDENMDKWPRSAALRGRVPHIVVLADLIRIEQVWRYGGVYMDTDTVPLEDITPLTEAESWLVPVGTPGEPEPVPVVNGFFGFRKAHPFLAEAWNRAVTRLDMKSPTHIAGPHLFRKVQADMPQPVLPTGLIPDLDIRVMLTDEQVTQSRLKELYPEALVVHLADKSWLPASRRVRLDRGHV